jgi:ectoine hydroxylase-related dioxygenase (phytanoyl-CoA dioxygenase family)
LKEKEKNAMDSSVVPQGLSLEQVGFYALNGYLLVDDILTSGECDHLVELAEARAEENFPAVYNLDRTISDFRQLVMQPDLVGMLETLQGRKMVSVMSQFLFKKVGSGYASQAWNPHQDNIYPKCPPGDYITTNIFLSDSDKENGGLIMYPGSHREGLFPAVPTISHREKIGSRPGNRVEVPKRFKPVDLTTKKGSCLFLAGEVLHESYPNVSPTRSRPLYQVTYLPFGVPFWPGLSSDKRVFLLHPADDYFES